VINSGPRAPELTSRAAAAELSLRYKHPFVINIKLGLFFNAPPHKDNIQAFHNVAQNQERYVLSRLIAYS